jgi:hypothetical protein
MKRRLFNFLIGFSLLLCVATAGMWVRSYFVTDMLVVATDRPTATGWTDFRYTVKAGKGLVGLDRVSSAWPTSVFAAHGPPANGAFLHHQPSSSPMWSSFGLEHTRWNKIGFGYHEWGAGSSYSLLTIIVPLWLVLSITAILPGIWLYHKLREYRHRLRCRRLGLCTKCGYDLRASNDKCPECGAAIIMTMPQPASEAQ